MMTRTRKLVALSLLFAIGMSEALTAQAGILDWFASNDATAERASDGSFDSLYASIQETDRVTDDTPLVLAQAVVPVNSPSGPVQKTLRRFYWVDVSAYNSEVAQTDASPFITAMGTHVRDGIVASNMFPFGTVIKIPSLFGDKIFVVEDRMNTRYQNNVDVWMESKADAVALGRRTVQIEVIQ